MQSGRFLPQLTVNFEFRRDLLPRTVLVVDLLEARIARVEDFRVVLDSFNEKLRVESHFRFQFRAVRLNFVMKLFLRRELRRSVLSSLALKVT